MTASPTQVNGTSRPRRLPVMGDWQAIDQPTTPEQEPTSAAEAATAATDTTPLMPDPVAEAEAAAIRARSYAEAEERRIKAEAEAEAIKIKAEGEAERQRIVNERANMRLEKERTDHEARIAEANRKREESDRLAAKAREEDEAQKRAARGEKGKAQLSTRVWFWSALGFAIVCAIVALPVQVSAFYSKDAPWLAAAPFVLEGAAWVVLMGAAAAVMARRPHWHYRLIAWSLAFVAASINLSHGLIAFDPATAIGTAFASLAGPGVWDLHEHGRIRTRDGNLTRKERKAQRKADQRAAAERNAAAETAKENAEKLAKDRAEKFSKVWEHALKIAAAVGETIVTEAVWRRAHRDIEGTDPGESAETIRARNIAEKRVESARTGTPVNTLSKNTNAQRVNQMPRAQRGPARKPPVRRPGDTQRYVKAARKQAAITAKNAANGDAN